MFLKVLGRGVFDSNTYIVGDNGEVVVIDPGNNADEIIAAAGDVDIKYILLTHTHIDHMLFVDDLQSKTGAKVVAHSFDANGFTDSRFNVSAFTSGPRVFRKADMLVEEGDTISLGGLTFEFIHTPGHTPGSMCVKAGDLLFTGDTIFEGDFGRTDLPYAQPEKMRDSVDKVFAMGQDLMIYPGHGPSDTLGNIILKSKAAYKYL